MARQAEVNCPSGLRVKFRSIKGKDLDALRNKRRLATGESISQVLNDCTVEIIDKAIYGQLARFDWADVLVGDRLAAIIGLRKATTGDTYEFRVRCQDESCKRMIDWTVDLNTLNTKELTSSARDVFLATNEFQVEVEGKVVVFGLTNGRDQAAFARRLERIRQSRNENEKALLSLLFRIKSVEGVDKEKIGDWLDDLDLAEINRIQREMDKVDCGIETGILVECPHCSLTQEIDLPLGSQLFGDSS